MWLSRAAAPAVDLVLCRECLRFSRGWGLDAEEASSSSTRSWGILTRDSPSISTIFRSVLTPSRNSVINMNSYNTRHYPYAYVYLHSIDENLFVVQLQVLFNHLLHSNASRLHILLL